MGEYRRVKSHRVLDHHYHLHAYTIDVVLGVHFILKQFYDSQKEIHVAKPAENIVDLRAIPYDKWIPGQTETITIFSGKRKEDLTIKYHGIEYVKGDKKTYRCYHITFIFTSDGGRKTSDDMDAWISADSRRIPIRLEGKLPVGKVYCVYSGQ